MTLDRPEPTIVAVLPCRFGCREPAAAIVHYPAACICFADPVQALCRQHVEKGFQNNDGRIVAWLGSGEDAGLEARVVAEQDRILAEARDREQGEEP